MATTRGYQGYLVHNNVMSLSFFLSFAENGLGTRSVRIISLSSSRGVKLVSRPSEEAAQGARRYRTALSCACKRGSGRRPPAQKSDALVARSAAPREPVAKASNHITLASALGPALTSAALTRLQPLRMMTDDSHSRSRRQRAAAFLTASATVSDIARTSM